MSFEDALAIANAALQASSGRRLSDIETLIFEGAWHGETYPRIANKAGYSINYLTTDVGPKFWKVLSQALDEPVNKKSFKTAVQRYAAVGQGKAAADDSAQSEPLPTLNLSISWGEAPEVSQFYGRDEELAILQHWAVEERCRLIAILGMGGIGKSTLATKAAQQWASGPVGGGTGNGTAHQKSSSPSPPCPSTAFSHVIWRSLRNAPPLETLLADLIDILSDHQEAEAERSRLLFWLREKRCLIVLDNLETILQAGAHAGYYREGYEDYGELIRLLGETSHQSCVVLTSREKPAEVALLAGLDGGTRTLQLGGSVETALALIQAKQLQGTAEQARTLCDRYSYNPLALKIVSTTIQDLFDGDIGAFLAEDAVIFSSIRRLLSEQFQRLTELEQAIMMWLAINRDWTALKEISADLVPAVPKAHLLAALESLKWRGLIESQQKRYTQQPVVMEYVTERLVEEVCREVTTAQWRRLHCHALVKTTVQDFVSQAQQRLLLAPVAHHLQAQFPTTQALTQQMAQLLAALRSQPLTLSGYEAGNLINLSLFLELSLTQWNFSGLMVRQADLRRRLLQQVNFANAHFSQCAFTETFGTIFSLSYSLDGETLFTGDNTGHLRQWRGHDLQPTGVIKAHSSYIWGLLPSPDQQHLATCSEDYTVKVWDLETGNQRAGLDLSDTMAQTLAWLGPNQLVVGGIDGQIRLWSPFADQTVELLQGHSAMVSGLSWNPQTQVLASSSLDGSVKLWNVAQQCLATGLGHDGPVRDVAWHPEGKALASGGEDNAILLWHLQMDQPPRRLLGHQNTVWSLSWSPDGRYLASSSHDSTVRLWHGESGTCVRVLKGHQNWVWQARWHPIRPLLTSGSHDGTLKLWNPETGQCLKTLLGNTSSAWALALSPTDNLLAKGCSDTMVRLWRPGQPAPTGHLIGHSHMVCDLAWSPAGDRLASASHDRTIRIWRAATGRCQQVLTGHDNWVWSVDWHPHEALIASASSDNSLKLWHPDQPHPLQTLTAHDHWVLAVRWHPQGQWLASASADKTLRLWHPKTWECRHILTDHDHWIWRLAWCPSGRMLASGGYDHTLRLWQVTPESVRCRHVLPRSSILSAIAWHPQQPIVAAGYHDSQIILWHAETGEAIAQLQGHANQVPALVFSADGQYLYSSSEDATVKTWDWARETCFATHPLDLSYEGMNISGAQGFTQAQRSALKALGATDSASRNASGTI